MRHQRSGSDRALIRGALLALQISTAAAGCSSPSSDGRDETPGGPLDIADGEVWVADGRVTSPCYSFELPDGYVATEGGPQCATSLRAIGSGRLDIFAFPDTEYASMDAFFEGMQLLFPEDGAQEIETIRSSLHGRSTGIVEVTQSSGLQSNYLFISVESGKFTAAGVPVTAIAISFFAYDSQAVDAANRVLDTLEISD